MRLLVLRKRKQSFAAPDAHDPYVCPVAAVDDAKWWMDQLAQERLIELGHDPIHLRMVPKGFDACKDFPHEPIADIGDTLLDVPALKRLLTCGTALRRPALGKSRIISTTQYRHFHIGP